MFARIAFFLLASLHCLAAAPLITNLADVRMLTHEQAAGRLQVEVVGTVIYCDRNSENSGGPEGLIMHDGTAGCFVSSPVSFPDSDLIRPGTRIRTKGLTNPDSYFPNISEAVVEILGQGELPEPLSINSGELFKRAVDSEWVEIDAVVVGVEPGGLAFTVVVEIDGRTFKVEVPETVDAQSRVAGLMQRRVRLQGVVGTIYNDAWQLTGRHFFVPSFDHLRPVEGGMDKGSVPLREIASLLRSNHGTEDMVRARGTVTQTVSGGFYLLDGTASTYVQAAGAEKYPAGSMVEVEGFAAVAPFRPVLRAARIANLGETALPPPTRINPELGVFADRHHERVEVDCVFLALRDGLRETVLQCRVGDTYFEAHLPGTGYPSLGLNPGDVLRLTGIYEVTTTRPMPRVEWADGFRVNLPDTSAVRILHTAPWWTPERVLLAFALALVALCFVFVWNWLLRRRVAAQSIIIKTQVEQGAIKDERERIARELHDTLEQDLTGLSMQLGNLAPALEDDQELARQRLSLARSMLQHCRTEARASVSDLRNPHLIGRCLPEAMNQSLPDAAKDCAGRFEFKLTGTPRPLRATTQNHLLRIAREAVFNAARHANPQTIRVCLSYDSTGVLLNISDDGRGFDVTRRPPVGHFGLIGMRERANKIHAEFFIDSKPDTGTKILVRLPWSSPVAHPRLRS